MLAIDIETYSETDIKFGVHKYSEDPKFEILLFAYSFNNVIEIVDFASGETLPKEIKDALNNPAITKTAYNAAFEIACISKFFTTDYNQWSCTQALAAQAGYPFGLDKVASVMGTIAQKDKIGKELIKFFSMPVKPTKANSFRTRNMPVHDYSKWMDFKEYCKQDVATEIAVRNNLSWFKEEEKMWHLDQKINNAGVRIDKDLVVNAISIESIFTTKVIKEMTALTNIQNPKSNKQVKDYLNNELGEDLESLSKTALDDKTFTGDALEVISLREKLSRTSIKKFTAMLQSACSDERIYDLFLYYGANRTGRWSGRNVQLQNLKRNDLEDLNFARRLVKENNLTVLDLSYDDAGHVLSNLVRTAFIPSEDYDFTVTDFSAIEARIVAWLADEQWRIDVFKSHGKIYEASASKMFNIPLDIITKEIRTKGKIAELALGYQGSVGALLRMGAIKMGLTEEELLPLVQQWRKANRKIVKFWYDVQSNVINTLSENIKTKMSHGLVFYMNNKNLIITLPSGRELVYIDAEYKHDKITYMGMDQTTKMWMKQDTYGGKLTENITQAIARDVLADAMLRIDQLGYKIVMHIHDEIVFESNNKDTIKEINDLLSNEINWAKGLPLKAETFTAKYYQK